MITPPEHMSEEERCDAQLNIPLCGRALRSVAHGQSKSSANVPLKQMGKPKFFSLFIMKLLNKCIN